MARCYIRFKTHGSVVSSIIAHTVDCLVWPTSVHIKTRKPQRIRTHKALNCTRLGLFPAANEALSLSA